jgi:cell division protein FtsQ
LVDKTGMDFEVVPMAPEGLPKLGLARARPDDSATKAALTVLTQLPPALREQVVEMDARSEIEVSAVLADNRVVVFGSSDDVAHKAQVTLILLSQPAHTYNVSYPNQPALSN